MVLLSMVSVVLLVVVRLGNLRQPVLCNCVNSEGQGRLLDNGYFTDRIKWKAALVD